MTSVAENPAEVAAKESMAQVISCLDTNRSFVLEAGAGAGKTYSLITSLKHLIGLRGPQLIREGQKIACITYTNVATEEIKSRIDNHPAVVAETIHSFCWSIIKNFQPHLRGILPTLGKWGERIVEQGEIGDKKVLYDLGYPKIEEDAVLLHHDDVLALTIELMKIEKFRKFIKLRYPVIFIDEYQDTNKEFVDSMVQHFIQTGEGPALGFYGDHWQKIYGTTACGKISHDNLVQIGKKANFRSEKKIVECLNRIRPELPQHVSNPDSLGEVSVFHTNNWVGTRRTGGHWGGDLPAEISRSYLNRVRQDLSQNGWVFEGGKTKILMLTHNVLSEEQGYKNLADAFSRNDSFIKKEDSYIAFFVDVLEPMIIAYQERKFGLMFSILGMKGPAISTSAKKAEWAASMRTLQDLRATGTIAEVVAHLAATGIPRLPNNIEARERKCSEISAKNPAERSEDENETLGRHQKFMSVRYSEVVTLSKFIEDQTPFATKHGVKGAEFENVLVVFGRGWNQYNFNQMLEWALNGIPADKQESYERNRNLFYVACSRPQKRLALLFTQQLSDAAIECLENWFERQSVSALAALN